MIPAQKIAMERKPFLIGYMTVRAQGSRGEHLRMPAEKPIKNHRRKQGMEGLPQMNYLDIVDIKTPMQLDRFLLGKFMHEAK